MTWSVEWSPVAERDVLHMPWRLAARIYASVFELAEHERGRVDRTDAPGIFRLRVPGAVALIRVDAATRTLHVQRLLST